MTAYSHDVGALLTLHRRLLKLGKTHENWGAAEVMRLATAGPPSDETAVVLCRLLFRSRSGSPLRTPHRGAPVFLGGADSRPWPLAPVHVFGGVPFYISRGWTLAGLPESAAEYLAHCLRRGCWRPQELIDPDTVDLQSIAHDFVARGPWVRPLDESERAFVFAQVASR